MLISGRFPQQVYDEFPLSVCSGWLRSRELEISALPSYFRKNRTKLPETLMKIQGDLAGLFTKLDRLCGGPGSYSSNSSSRIPQETIAYYDEFTDIYDELSNALELYLMYAIAYKAKISKEETLDSAPLGRDPADLSKTFLSKLKLLQAPVEKMAKSIEEQCPPLDVLRQSEPEGHLPQQGLAG